MFPFESSIEQRHGNIRKLLNDQEPLMAVLLSAVDFEWTVRRAIIALGTSANVDIRSGVLRNCSGLNSYKAAWNQEVKPKFHMSLEDVICDWDNFKSAFNLRHQLVHGISKSTGVNYATSRVEKILNATAKIVEYAKSKNVNLCERLPIRQKHVKRG